MIKTRNGVLHIRRPPSHFKIEETPKLSRGGGATIGDASVKGMKKDGLGSHWRLGIRPSLCNVMCSSR
jgi:hypothetical protein